MSQNTPPRIVRDSVVMFSAYLYLVDPFRFRVYVKLKDQSDNETRLPRKLVRRCHLAHPAGSLLCCLRVGPCGRSSNCGDQHHPLLDAASCEWGPAYECSHPGLAE